MNASRSGINLHRPLRPGELGQRFRRIRATIPSVHESDAESDEIRESDTDEYWDPWRPGHIRFGDWKIERTWDELLGAAGGTIAERVPHLNWAEVPVVGSGEAPRESRPAPPRWAATELPAVLHESLTELERTDRVPLSPASDAAKMDLSAFRRIAKHYQPIDFPERTSAMGGIAVALYLAAFWVRRPADFVPKNDDLRQTVPDLMEHLFAVHPVPPCLRNAWFACYDDEAPDLRWIAWFILTGQGASIQRAGPVFGWRASPALLRHLPEAPGDLTPTDGFIWADIKRLGGDETELRRLRVHPEYAYCPVWLDGDPRVLPDPQPHEFEDFLADTVRWLARHRRVLTDEMCQLILPWGAHLYRIQMHTTEHFSWKGRSPARAHRLAVEYAQGIEMPYPNLRWKAKGLDWKWTTEEDGTWSVRELLSAKELYEEGQAMSHCVSAYATHCHQGLSVICSLRRGGRRRLTLEVHPDTFALIQARGAGNRAPTPQELVRLHEWQDRKLQNSKGED